MVVIDLSRSPLFMLVLFLNIMLMMHIFHVRCAAATPKMLGLILLLHHLEELGHVAEVHGLTGTRIFSW